MVMLYRPDAPADSPGARPEPGVATDLGEKSNHIGIFRPNSYHTKMTLPPALHGWASRVADLEAALLHPVFLSKRNIFYQN